MIEPPRSNPLAGPEPTAPSRPPEPTQTTKARPGLRRQFANARSLVSGGLRADLSRVPTPGNLRAAGSGLISIGLERFAAGNPLWTLFLSRLPFKGRTRQAIQAACGGSSCCGCSSCTSCGGACFSPPGWIALAIVGIILVFSVIFNTRPSFTLPLLCERGDTSACAMLGSGGSVTLSVSPEEIPSGAIDGYQRIEEQTGVPWFYLLAWEKVASDFGRADFTFQNATPPPGDALEAEANEVRRRISAAAAHDSSDGEDLTEPGAVDPETEKIRIEIERERNNFVDALTSALRGGSFGYHLLTGEEYQARGRNEEGQLRNPWNRFDGGRILAESLLDIYARIARGENGQPGRFVAPIDRQTISPPTAPVLNQLVEALIEKEKGEGDGGIEDVVQWTSPAPLIPHRPHFSPCDIAFLCVGDGADWKATWPEPSAMPELPPPPPEGERNLYTVYKSLLYQGGGSPISSDERYYLCRRLGDARAEGRLGAENYRRSATLPDEALRSELAEQCQIFITADQIVQASTTPESPGAPAAELGASFAEEIAPYYTSHLRNPEIPIGEEVTDWKRLKIVMGAIVADADAWGAETGSFFSVDRSVPITDGQPSDGSAPDEVRRSSVEVSAYAEAINSYAESIYRAWIDARGLRDSTKSPERRAADADALFAGSAIDDAAAKHGIEPIYLAATLAADGLFASDIRRSLETEIDAGACRPYTSVGSSDGTLNGTNASIILARAISVLDLSDAQIPTEYRDQLLSFSESERVDPLLIAAIARVASDWDSRYDAADQLGHAGLTGLLLADERAYLAAFDPPDRFNPAQAITGGSRKISKLIAGRGLKLGLASYWAGAEASALAGSSFARFPKTAQAFANDVVSEYRRLAALGGEQSATGGDARLGSSGIGGCWRFGTGLADSYAPSGGPLTVAMNHCIASRASDCGQVEITVPGSSKKVIAEVVDYLDGDQGTADQRWIAIGPELARQLGLTGGPPWKVTLRLIDPAGLAERPDPSLLSKAACRARSVSSWPRAALFGDVATAIDWTARCLVAADARLDDIPVRLTDPAQPAVEEKTPLRRWGRLDGPWGERSDCISDRKPRSEVDPVYPLVTFTAPSWCDYRQIILSESRQRVLDLGLLGGGTLYGNAPVSALGFSWPVADPFITSGWLPRDSFPGSIKIVTKGKTIYPHSGLDMRSDQGSGVDMAGRGIYATADGWLSWTSGGTEIGTCADQGGDRSRQAAWLVIYHDSGIVSRYVHLELDANGDPLLPENIRARFNSTDDSIARSLNIPTPGAQHSRAVRVSRGELIGWYWEKLCHLHYEVWAGRIGPSGDVRRFGLDPVAIYYGSTYESFPRMNRFDPLELLPQGGGNLGWATSGYQRWWGGYPPPFNLAAEQDRLFPAPP